MIKIEHVAVWAADIEELRAFYETYFAANANNKYVNTAKGYSSYFLSFDSGARLELMHRDSVPDTRDNPYDQFTGFIHLAISVGSEEAVDSVTNRLSKDGYEVLGACPT